MAKRAKHAFRIALDDGSRFYDRDAVVPADVAKKAGDNVYDDGGPAPAAKKTAAAKKDD